MSENIKTNANTDINIDVNTDINIDVNTDINIDVNTNIDADVNDYIIVIKFNMFISCKSYSHLYDINQFFEIHKYIKHTNNTKNNLKLFQREKIKPDKYLISLYDSYNREYWILYKSNLNSTKLNLNQIKILVDQYVKYNLSIYTKCIIEMSIYLLQKLNNYNIILFKNYFKDFFMIITNDKIISAIYIDKFVDILDEIEQKYNENNNSITIGNYIMSNYKEFFYQLLESYTFMKINNYIINDSYYIIDTINTICK